MQLVPVNTQFFLIFADSSLETHSVGSFGKVTVYHIYL